MASLHPQRAGHALARPAGSPSDGHRVHFYDSEPALASVVAGFLAEGLRAGQTGLVIAAEERNDALGSGLATLGVDAEAAVARGRLQLVDARALLDGLLVDGAPDRARFDAEVGGLLDRAGAGGHEVRVYAEMVDLLWRDEREWAAVALEEMWNQLAARRRFSLLCAYRMSRFHRPSGPDGLRAVCSLHGGGLHLPQDGWPDSSSARDPRMLALEAEIRERQRAEAALRERNEDLNDFLDNSVEGLHSAGPDGTILWANRAELAMLGYSRDEYVGRKVSAFHVDPDLIADLLRRLARGEAVGDCEAQLCCKDGSTRHVRINAHAVFRDGELVRIRSFTRDVTAEKLAGEETSRLLEALVEAGRAKDDFIAMLSHELRGPLASIRSAVQLMQLRGDAGVTREREIIDRQVGNLVRLVEDLLDASRIGAGKLELRRDRLDVADVVDMAIEMVAPMLEARGHALHVRASRGSAFVDGDAVRLAQVLSNLLGNAAKYTERSGRVSLEVTAADGQVVIAVRDTGIGIDPELLPRIFERGVQGRHGVGGLGLGLTIVRAIVELHGGTVSAHSAGPGRGSEFRVALPLVEAAGPPASGPQPATPTSDLAAPVRLLIVDDDADLADSLAELLARRGFITRVASDGEEAIRAFAQFRPHAALIDISLPMSDGRALARHLRGSGSRATLIAMSGFGRREDEEASLAAGFDLHLVKPLRVDVIDGYLRSAAAGRFPTSGSL